MNPWSVLAGHDLQREAWLEMRRAGRLPHALLLTGPSGIGKRLWALAAAKTLLCDAPDGPCGTCTSCTATSAGSHPDLIETSPRNGKYYIVAKNKETGAEDEIRPLVEKLTLTPALSKHKVLVLDRADGLSKYGAKNPQGHEAADALLKIIEEPPSGTFLILVADRADLRPTILSRCRRFSFAPLDRAAFRKALGARDSEALYRVSRGSPGEALRMLEAGLMDQRAGLLELVGAPHSKALELAASRLIPKKPSAKEAGEQEATPLEIRRREAVDRLNLLSTLLRDRMAPEEARMHPDLPKAAPADLTLQIRAVEEALDSIQGNVDLNLALECCALALAR